MNEAREKLTAIRERIIQISDTKEEVLLRNMLDELETAVLEQREIPTLRNLTPSNLEETKDCGSFTVSRYRNDIVVMYKGGHTVIVSDTNRVEHFFLDKFLLGTGDENASEEDNTAFRQVIDTILRAPMYIFANPKYATIVSLTLAKYALKLQDEAETLFDPTVPDEDITEINEMLKTLDEWSKKIKEEGEANEK